MDDESHVTDGDTAAFREMRWIDLTALQLLLGTVASVTWLRFSQTVHTDSSDRKHNRAIMFAALGHLVGNLATNAAFAAVRSSTTLIIKACEPLFTIILMFWLGQGKIPSCLNICSVVVMCIGACMFVSSDRSIHVWGVCAAVVSNVAFPIRNIIVKSHGSSGGSVHDYSVLSIYGMLFLVPIILIKLLVNHDLPRLMPAEGSVAGVYHVLYNAASLAVLSNVTPMTHAVLNLSKRIFAIIANIVYFQMPCHSAALIALVVFTIGNACYALTHKQSKLLHMNKIVVGILIMSSAITLIKWKHEYALEMSSHNSSWLNAEELLDRSVSYPGHFNIADSPENSAERVKPINTSNSSKRFSENVKMFHTADSSRSLPEGHILTEFTCPQSLTSSWVFDQKIPPEIVKNIENIHTKFPQYHFNIYCGTSHCVDTITHINNPNITATFLQIDTIVEDTPLERWFVRHPFNKVIAGIHFEDHLQGVVELALMWQFGGIYIDPALKIEDFEFPCQSHSWVVQSKPVSTHITPHGLLALAYFGKMDGFINDLANSFVENYPILDLNSTKWPLSFDYRSLQWGHHKACDGLSYCPDIFRSAIHKVPYSNKAENHYGILSVDKRVNETQTSNLGDEIQVYPGTQFLPFVDGFVFREAVTASDNNVNIAAFFNSWWGSPSTQWPPPRNVHPILTSMHISRNLKPTMERSVEYLRSSRAVARILRRGRRM